MKPRLILAGAGHAHLGVLKDRGVHAHLGRTAVHITDHTLIDAQGLALLNTADGQAIGQWGPFSVQGPWLMALKDTIDRRFIRRHAAIAAASLKSSRGDYHA